MKKLLCAALAAFVVYASPHAKAQGTLIAITPYIGPYDRTQEFLDNFIAGNTGTDSPAKPSSIENGTVHISSLVCTPTFYSWKGSVAAATGAFALQRGNRIYFTVDITSSTPFMPYDVVGTTSSHFFSFENSLGSFQAVYDLRGRGYAADGTVYTSGPMNQPVTRLRYIGYTYSIEIGGGTQQAINNSLSSWQPFDLTGSYSINGQSVSSTVHISVPEPSSLSIMALALGTIALRRRK
jgi:hypothetical protein